MQTIKSKDNKIFKSFNKLNQKKFRDREGLFVVEGDKLLLEAVKSGADIVTVAVRSDREGDYDDAYVFDDRLFEKIADTVSSQGVAAIVKKPDYTDPGEDGDVVVLDRIQDPGNAGSIIRTCDAAGISRIIAVKGTVDLYSPKVVRACAGSVFRVPIIEMETKEAIDALKNKEIIASTPRDAIGYKEIDIDGDKALIIGNEANGISEEFFDASDARVMIPMKGDIESLNAGVAAGILIYELLI